jgi:hypothetical protein
MRLTALELEARKQRGINAALKARLKKLEPEEAPAKEETEDN